MAGSSTCTSTKTWWDGILYTRHLPDPDLVVRTSGEMRLSNFLLWQLAYAEIYVTPTLWPDFRGVHLLEGIAEYQKRERRYGGLNHGDAHAEQSALADKILDHRGHGVSQSTGFLCAPPRPLWLNSSVRAKIVSRTA